MMKKMYGILLMLGASLLLVGCPDESKVFFVKAGSNGDGTSFAKAYGSIQTGLDEAKKWEDAALPSVSRSAQVWVAKGSYTGAITLKAGIPLYGGYKGTADETLDNWAQAFVNRDLNENTTVVNGNNAYHVVTGASGAAMDGFTIKGGKANGTAASDKIGAGFYATGDYNVLVSHCFIRENIASDSGGGIACLGGCWLNLSNSKVYNNKATNNGGAVYATAVTDFTASECTFQGNTAKSGAGLYFEGAAATPASFCFLDCKVVGNTASVSGGGIYTKNLNIVCDSIMFAENKGGSFGGGLYCESCAPSLENCTFVKNEGLYGSQVCNHMGASCLLTHCTLYGSTWSYGSIANHNTNAALPAPKLVNCILWSAAGTEVYAASNASKFDITYSCVKGNTVYAGTGNINTDPEVWAKWDTDTKGYDVTLRSFSPCIDACTTTAALLYDMDDTVRPQNGVSDMGAFEFKKKVATVPATGGSTTGKYRNMFLEWKTAMRNRMKPDDWQAISEQAVAAKMVDCWNRLLDPASASTICHEVTSYMPGEDTMYCVTFLTGNDPYNNGEEFWTENAAMILFADLQLDILDGANHTDNRYRNHFDRVLRWIKRFAWHDEYVPSADTGVTGTNRIHWRAANTVEKDITVNLVAQGINTPLSISVTGHAVTVRLATNSSGNAISTVPQLREILVAQCHGLVSMESTDTGVIAPQGPVALVDNELDPWYGYSPWHVNLEKVNGQPTWRGVPIEDVYRKGTYANYPSGFEPVLFASVLMMASATWGDTGAFNYRQDADLMLSAITDTESLPLSQRCENYEFWHSTNNRLQRVVREVRNIIIDSTVNGNQPQFLTRFNPFKETGQYWDTVSKTWVTIWTNEYLFQDPGYLMPSFEGYLAQCDTSHATIWAQARDKARNFFDACSRARYAAANSVDILDFTRDNGLTPNMAHYDGTRSFNPGSSSYFDVFYPNYGTDTRYGSYWVGLDYLWFGTTANEAAPAPDHPSNPLHLANGRLEFFQGEKDDYVRNPSSHSPRYWPYYRDTYSLEGGTPFGDDPNAEPDFLYPAGPGHISTTAALTQAADTDCMWTFVKDLYKINVANDLCSPSAPNYPWRASHGLQYLTGMLITSGNMHMQVPQ